jgi:hypothetical protein
VTSDGGGSLLLRQADRRLGLLKQVRQALVAPHRQSSCEHSLLSMLRQRIYGLAQGYEDLNDHERLRKNLALQTATDRDSPGQRINNSSNRSPNNSIPLESKRSAVPDVLIKNGSKGRSARCAGKRLSRQLEGRKERKLPPFWTKEQSGPLIFTLMQYAG